MTRYLASKTPWDLPMTRYLAKSIAQCTKQCSFYRSSIISRPIFTIKLPTWRSLYQLSNEPLIGTIQQGTLKIRSSKVNHVKNKTVTFCRDVTFTRRSAIESEIYLDRTTSKLLSLEALGSQLRRALWILPISSFWAKLRKVEDINVMKTKFVVVYPSFGQYYSTLCSPVALGFALRGRGCSNLSNKPSIN